MRMPFGALPTSFRDGWRFLNGFIMMVYAVRLDRKRLFDDGGAGWLATDCARRCAQPARESSSGQCLWRAEHAAVQFTSGQGWVDAMYAVCRELCAVSCELYAVCCDNGWMVDGRRIRDQGYGIRSTGRWIAFLALSLFSASSFSPSPGT